MRVSELLHSNVVFPSVSERDKSAVLSGIAAHLSSCYRELDRDRLTSVLLKRERLMSTALADGVAIPHARMRGLSRTVAAFGRSRAGIEWDAQDGRPTNLFFILVVPDDTESTHLKILAAASRVFRDPVCRARLMAASDEQLLATLRSEEERLSNSRSATLVSV
jgi:PTS system nitrogen regulatory IIA component